MPSIMDTPHGPMFVWDFTDHMSVRRSPEDAPKARKVFESLKSLDTSGLGGVAAPPYLTDSRSFTGRLGKPRPRAQNLPTPRLKPKPRRPRRVVVSLLDTQLIADEENNNLAVELVRRELDPTPSKIQYKLDCVVDGDPFKNLLDTLGSKLAPALGTHTEMLRAAVERAKAWKLL